jgi:hypothetical protein
MFWRRKKEMNKYPVGPKTMERAAKTEAGKLAAALSRLMYGSDNADIGMRSHTDSNGVVQYTIHARKYVCPEIVFRNSDELPKGVPAAGHEGRYFYSEKLLFAVRDYLEAAAIREVCE